MRVTVLCGGPSAEREVSLVSGKSVADGLRGVGHDVFVSDVNPADLSGLDHAADVVFPVLHGRFGESGELQEILEARGVPFVGSGSTASRLGMDKAATKRAWAAAGLPTPAWVLAESAAAGRAFIATHDRVVVKATDSGSSIDVYVCTTAGEANAALDRLLASHGRALVEQFVDGPELTVGLLEEQPLAPIRIVPKSAAFFDYDAKYRANDTEHRFDTGLPAAVVEACRDLARRANAVVGARDLSRVDVMIDGRTNRPYLLEINTLPGFTPKSLLPEAAAHAGVAFGPLVDRLVRRAHGRVLARTAD